eukprot:SAG31_NODE_722_length_12572_cov_2.409124_5_plen_301_part_00
MVTSVKDTFVFNGSVRENIEFGATASDIDKAEETDRVARGQAAAEAADLWGTIAAMTNGLDTSIGSRSEQDLSDGQTQRLSIARGLINDKCRLLLLDEPTSAVDGPTETKIMKNLEERRKIDGIGQIMVAHRMSTLTACDKIVFLINPAADAFKAIEMDNDKWLRLLLDEHDLKINTIDMKGRTLLEVAIAQSELLQQQRTRSTRSSGRIKNWADGHRGGDDSLVSTTEQMRTRSKCAVLLEKRGACRGIRSHRGIRNEYGACVGEEGTHAELLAKGGLYADFYHEMMLKEVSGSGNTSA